jgi:predicted ArsR family transcriptional regulator
MDMKKGRQHLRPPLLRTTKGQVLVCLCRGPQTVTQLAAQLGITDNAIRAQLQRLQRDGLVRRTGLRRGSRRPHAEYQLTSQARQLFPRAYEPMLQKLMDVLTQRLPQRLARDLILRTGRQLIAERLGQMRGRTVRQRLAEILRTLNGAGLGIDLVESKRTVLVRSCGCPLASLTATHPELCDLFSKLFTHFLGAPVRQCCEREESPRCGFEVATP